MKYLCLNCGIVFDVYVPRMDIHNHCMISSCLLGPVIEVDDNMLEAIKILNEKGYKTLACCGGHIYNQTPNFYIAFDVTLSSAPAGCRFENYLIEKGEDSISSEIRSDIDEIKNKTDLQIRINELSTNLLIWANELPNLKKE